jgi:hypothetical protein
LCALAGSVESFEGDEFSAARHRGMIAAWVGRCTDAPAACYSLKFCDGIESI